jgi:hypothetical protein
LLRLADRRRPREHLLPLPVVLLPDVGEIEVVTNGFLFVCALGGYAPPKDYGVAELFGMLSIEAARRFDDSRSYDDELLNIVDQARTNPNACIIGTIFSYKPD